MMKITEGKFMRENILLSITQVTASPMAEDIGELDFNINCANLERFLEGNPKNLEKLYLQLDEMKQRVLPYMGDSNGL